jgi:UDP-2-acetamido-3-amino-2,3-dideoxy-glucuronate N-acetyltransferase
VTHSQPQLGLIGVGYWGKNILRNLSNLGLLHTACDSAEGVTEKWQNSYPEVRFTHSVDEVMDNPEIDGIVIAAPAVLHYDLAKRAIAAGKDVLVEKPLALTAEKGAELVQLAEDAGRVLMVGHILQYHSAVLKLKELLDSGRLGDIQYIYSNRLSIGKLRTEENILWSFAPHDISVILMLLGRQPERVDAFGGAFLNSHIFDTTLTTLEFSGNIKAHIFVSWLHPFKEQKLVVVGSEGMVVFDDVSQEKLFVYPHKIEWMEGRIPVARKADYEVVEFAPAEPLAAELSHFADCVASRKTPRTDGNEGLRVLRVLEAAEHALSQRAGSNE